MNSQRNILIIALLFVSFIIWQTWQKDHVFNTNIPVNIKKSKNVVVIKELQNIQRPVSVVKKHRLITVKTDVLLLKINTLGGDIEQAFLLSYPNKLGSSSPFHLLKTSKEFVYQAQSGLTGKHGPDNPENGERPLYNVNKNFYILSNSQNELRVPMTYIASNGIIYTKTFILKRGDFAVNINYTVNNISAQPIELSLFGQLKQSIYLPKIYNNSNNFFLNNYRGAAYSTDDNKYQKCSFKNIKNKNLSINTNRGWIAMLQQYFVTAWIPCIQNNNTFYTVNSNNKQVIIGFKSSPITIMQTNEKELKAILWIGPKIQYKMAAITPYLDLVVDYGWLWFISQPLFKLLKFIYNYTNNWGFSIIIITFIVRCIMYPLTKAQYTSMAKIRMLQPKLIAIRERISHDKQRQNQEIIDLYKKEKVNPFGGCLPLIVQMPIFLALYYMLSSSIELRHAPFILWIHDLSAHDTYYILPIIMGITMLFIQKMSPNSITDPVQQKIMVFMPLIFIIFFLWFPSGLVLYYIISNLVTIIQQKFIYRSLKKRGLNNVKY